AYITNVAVSEKFRRRGIAEKLLEEAERGAIKRGCVLITLEVRASNDPAKALYKKRGFKEVGTRKNFYSDPREDAEIMTKFFDR
ncbi:MAG: ribosomal protein S18-alanine N-acetyltransferase, partial [Acutalibacteraceae bacterium]|nr:ribosomal protein S18-alanine N-acetyltransferase [Acutalibacteraceae bacterium]